MLISVFVGMSLDGFIARQDGSFDFLQSAEGSGGPPGFSEFWKSVDALLIGRKTYEVARGFPKWFYGKKPVFVLSTRRLAKAPKGAVVEHVNGKPHDIVLQLAARKFRHIYLDGGITVQRFLQAGLADRIIITRIPVLIGDGIPLFGAVHGDIQLEHIATRSSGGAVQSEYHVKNKARKTNIEPLWRDEVPKKRPRPRAKKS
jgi:dihydrofolate reductase